MNAVQEIKMKHDMDALLRAIKPRMDENVRARREQEAKKARANAALAKIRVPLRII